MQRGRTGVWMRSAFEVSPARRRKQAKIRRRQEHEWAGRVGPVVVRVRSVPDQLDEPDQVD
jgi:hypothetical protein